MKSIETFETNRLIARRVRAEDLADLNRLYRDSRVMATLGGVRPADETRARLRDHIAHWQRYGFGIWIFRDKANEQYVGRAGLQHAVANGRDEIELLYALMAQYWGRGYASEMARALLTIAFDDLGLKEVVAFTLPTNKASWRVMEKAGFRYESDIIHAGLPHVLYRLRASERARR